MESNETVTMTFEVSKAETVALPARLDAQPPAIADLRNCIIVDDETYQQTAKTLANFKHELKVLTELEEKAKRPHLDALKQVRADYAVLKQPYEEGEAILKKILIDYDTKQQQERDRLQREANELARKEREKLERRAAKAKDPERAQALQDQAAAVVAPVVSKEAPKVDGLHYVEKWDCEVVTKDLVPEEYKIVDMPLLRSVVSRLKASCRIPGVRVFMTKVAASKARQP
jgi:hypothetical protein